MILLNPSFTAKYPAGSLGALAVRRVQNVPKCEQLDQKALEILDSLKLKYDGLERPALKKLYPLKAYTEYYKKFGQNYQVLPQLESVLKGKKTLTGQPALIQAMFMAEIDSLLLTGGHDLNKLKLPLTVTIAGEGEGYTSISGREAAAVPGDMLLRDGQGIIGTVLNGPDSHSRITAETRAVLFVIYAPPGIQEADILNHLNRIEDYLRLFSPRAETELKAVFK